MPLQLNQRDALWWTGWLAWDAPGDRLQHGPASDDELISRFLRHACRRAKAGEVALGELYEAYCQWAHPQWLLVLAPLEFAAVLDRLGHAVAPSGSNGAGQVTGLRLRAPDDPSHAPAPHLPTKARPGAVHY